MQHFLQHRMNSKFYIYLTVSFLVLFMTVHSHFAEDQEEDMECDIKPGGAELHCEKEWDGVGCRFSYVAQGGTNEQWTLKLSRNYDQTEYSCSIERPSGQSYLFFQKFHLSVDGVDVIHGEVFGPKMKELNPAEYRLEGNSISDVPGKFTSQLDKVVLLANKPKQEL